MSEKPAPIWSETFKVHSYEIDFSQHATLETLCHYFQEAAWNHAERLGVGYTQLQGDQRLWVLSRLLVKIERYPKWGDSVTVRTWPRHARSVFAMRDFRICTRDDAVLAAGTSAWLVLDARSRKPLRADRVLAHFTELSEERALERDPDKLPTARGTASAAGSEVACYADIDVNGHVNYAWYIGCALNLRPVKFHQEFSPHWLEVNYLGETTGGESISIATEPISPEEDTHSISKAACGEEVCRLRIRWRKKPPAGDI